MNDIFKVIRFEFNRIMSSRAKMLYVIVLVMLAILTMLVVRHNAVHLVNVELSDAQREQTQITNTLIRDEYKIKYEYLYGIIDELPDSVWLTQNEYNDKAEVYNTYLRYDYYVNTKTCVYDYIDPDSPTSSAKGQESGVFLLLLSNAVLFVMLIVGIFLANSVASIDNNGTVKNILASKITRKRVFIGKTIAFILMLLLIYIFLSISGLLIAGGDASKILIVKEGHANLLNPKCLFLSKMILSLLVVITISSISLLIGIILKKKSLGILVTLGGVVVILAVFLTIRISIQSKAILNNIIQFFIFANAIDNNMSFEQLSLWIWIAVYIGISGTIFYLYTRKQAKIDL